MPSSGDSLSAKVQSSYRQLSTVASDLNAASDELGKPVADLDAALKKLNLGVSVWMHLRGNDDRDGSYWSDDLGYSKVGGKWGIALRSVKGDVNWPDEERVEAWLFNDAPRELRVQAIGKIPELLDKLNEKAVETAKKIRERLADAQQLAAAVKEAADKPKIERARLNLDVAAAVIGNAAAIKKSFDELTAAQTVAAVQKAKGGQK